MTYQNQQRQQNGGGEDAAGLLEQLLQRPINERYRALDAALEQRIPKIEELLPDFMKGQGERLSKRAMMTFARDEKLRDVPPQDFVRCVLEAAEMGFAIDGKMCYVVKYKSKYQCQLDYKGLVAVARRMKTIKDIYGDVVCENDHFVHRRRNGESVLDHTYNLGEHRGEVIGAYCVVILPDGSWRYEVMDRVSLNRIQDRAPSKNGPWSTDPDEMRKKTVFRRCLKLYGDDPGLIRVLELTDEGDGDEETTPTPPATVESLNARLTRTPPRREEPTSLADDYQPKPPDDHYDRPSETETPEAGQVPQGIDDAEAGYAACESEEAVRKWSAELRARNITTAELGRVLELEQGAKKRIRGPQKQKELAGT